MSPDETEAAADAAIEKYAEAGELYAQAKVALQLIEDRRPVVKEAAVRDIMERQRLAYQPAERLVESHPTYENFLEQRRAALLREGYAMTALQVARLNAELAVRLVDYRFHA